MKKSEAPMDPEITLRVRAETFRIPPIADGLLVGKRSPIGCAALRRTLNLLVPEPFEHIELSEDDTVSDVLVRKSILLKAPQDKLVTFFLRHVKPLMADMEILHLHLNVEAGLEGKL